MTVPQYRWLWSAADDYGQHRRRYTKSEIDRKVQRAGFAIVRSTGWVMLPLPVLAVSRLRDRDAGVEYDPCRELRVAGRANRVLEGVLTLEAWSIDRGLTLPFGASRLVVARTL